MRSIFFVGLMATLLAGCQTTQNIKDSDQLVRRDLEAASATLNHVRQGTANVDNGAVVRVVEDGYFGVGAPKVLNRDRTLPMTCNIVFNPTVPLDVLGFAQVLSRNPDCKLQVRVTQDALVALKDGYNINPPQAQAAAQPATGGIPALPALPGLPSAGGSMRAASFGNASPTMIQEQFKGDVTSLLDIVTSKLGLSWRYREGSFRSSSLKRASCRPTPSPPSRAWIRPFPREAPRPLARRAAALVAAAAWVAVVVAYLATPPATSPRRSL